MEFKSLEKKLGFKLIGIDVSGNLAKTRELIKENGATFPVLIDGDSYSREILHVTMTPTLFIIDGSGRIRSRLVGKVDNLERVVGGVLGCI